MGRHSDETDEERSERKRLKKLKKREPKRPRDQIAPVNYEDAHTIIATLIEVYPTALSDLQGLFESLDEGSEVQIDGIDDVLVKDSLVLLFECLQLHQRKNGTYVHRSVDSDRLVPRLARFFDSPVANLQGPSDPDRTQLVSPNVEPPRPIGPARPSKQMLQSLKAAPVDDSDDEIGPLLPHEHKPERFDPLALKALQTNSEEQGREEWLTQLPTNRTGISTSSSLITRTFRSGKHAEAAASASTPSAAWTDTAAQKQEKFEQAQKEREFNKKHKRHRLDSEIPSTVHSVDIPKGPSLLDQHQASLKSQPSAGHSQHASGGWDRERDLLGGGHMSGAKLTQMVVQSKGLGSRFKSGQL